MKPLKRKSFQIILYVILLVAVIIVMGFLRNCDNVKISKEPMGNSKGDTIDVAIIYGPLSYYLYKDTLGGLNYDLLHNFEKNTDTPIRFWPIVNITEALDKLEKGNYDLMASLPLDNDLKNKFLTTQSIYLDKLVLIQLADSTGKVKVNSALELANDTIFVPKGSPAISRLENLSNEIGEPVFINWENDESEEYLCMKIATGTIRYAVVNERTAEALHKRYPRLSYDNPISFTQFQVWVLPKTDSILWNKINTWFDDFKKKPEYKEILYKYS